ncbi:gastrokine-3-like [Choloepus didactylus]|uniref:gastrokine-3-like n=1 Tax=Choloepus didactylus TaxID=27675 RepID=UPI0018A120A9|nr:gastrokine-3-like [Choloepus didactylus]
MTIRKFRLGKREIPSWDNAQPENRMSGSVERARSQQPMHTGPNPATNLLSDPRPEEVEGVKQWDFGWHEDKIVSFSLVIFLPPTVALMNISDSHPLDGFIGTQIIHVNALRGIVSIRDNNVLSEWDGILDYKNDLLAAKLYSKMTCVLAKMDQAAFPTLNEITKALDQRELKHYPSTSGLTYTVLPIRVKNLAQYGMPIKDMCRDVPTYFAQQHREGMALATNPNSCFEVQLLSFMGLSICGEIPGL